MLLVMRRTALFLICFLFCATSATTALAQFTGLSGGTGSNLVLSPRFPEPGEAVRVSLNDYSINTNGATIQWFVDGTEVTNAANERTLTIRAKGLGNTTEIAARTTLPNGVQLHTKATIDPVRVDMLIEADTIAPSFYKGRTIPTVGSVVQVTALPFTDTAKAPTAFAYTWKVKGKVVGGGSRFGKNAISFNSGFGKNIPVAVDIYDSAGKHIASESIIVPLAEPELHFYEMNPLRGMSERVMDDTYVFIGNEVHVRAEPYFLDTSLLSSNPHVEWKLNNRSIENASSDPQEITLRKEGDRGSFNLEFHIRNLQQLLQGVEDSVTISF